MKKKIITPIVVCSLVFSLLGGFAKPIESSADTQEAIASLNYSYKTVDDCVSSSDATLSKTKYGTGKQGYSFTSGTLKDSAKLYASIDGTSKRKLEWSKDESDSTTSSSGEKYYTDSFAGGASMRQPVMSAGKKNQWGKNPYFEIQVSTSGYKDINFSAYIGASKKGPKSYRVSYALNDSTTFTAVSGTAMDLTTNKTMQKISATIPAANGQKLVKIRIEVTSLTALNGANMLDTSTTDKNGKTNSMKGEVAINHISVMGSKDSSAPTATPSANSSSSSSSSGSASTSFKVKKVTLKKKKLTLKKKKSATLSVSVKVTPNTKANVKAAKKKLKWSSSNKKVATVNKKGKVTAKKKGKATITVKYSKKLKATCKITVK